MTTTVAPLEISAERGDPLRLLPVAVNLLPTEVLAARANQSARRATVGLLVAALVGTGGWYYLASQDTAAARTDLQQAQDESRTALHGQRGFAPLVDTKARIDQVRLQVRQVTTGDVDWSRLYPAIRKAAPAGVVLSGLSGNAAVTSQTSGSTPQTPSGSGAIPAVPTGSLTITGHAPNKPSISDFLQRLTTVRGLVDPLVTSVAADAQTKKLTFSIQVSTTSKALNTRYSKAVK